jgi:predicted nucleic acid-binding protein
VSIVIDASVAVKWVLSEVDSDAADALLDEPSLIAPAIWLVEAANALWRRSRAGEISTEGAKARLIELLKAPVASLAVDLYLDAALDLAAALGHPIYDSLHLAVAIQHGTHVVTADRRFASLAGRTGFAGRIRLLGS